MRCFSGRCALGGVGYTPPGMSISASASALQSILVRQDVTAHNLANIQTPGFKRTQALNHARANGGTEVGDIRVDHAQGPLETATHAFDLAVQGEGFFKVQSGDAVRYVRAGVFGLDANRELVTPQGDRLSPSIRLPDGATGFAVQGDGAVLALMADGTRVEAGRITLTRFPNPGGLLQAGGGAFAPFPTAGLPQEGAPGTGGRGTLATGMLEGSNVDLAEETVASIRNLRTFQVNARMVRAQDEMLGTLLDVRQ